MKQNNNNSPDEIEEDPAVILERRRKHFATAPLNDLVDAARWDIMEKNNKASWDKHIYGNKPILTRTMPRDASAGIYVGALDHFVHDMTKKGKGDAKKSDDIAMHHLVETQPWRQALSVSPDRTQPVPTFGPMLLPESRDPVAALETEPEVEPRPTHWSPGTPAPQKIQGILDDFGNLLTALAARQVVALGFSPDKEAVANARSLSRTIRDYQRATHLEEERRALSAGQIPPNRRKPGPGRRPKLRLPDTDQVITLRLEYAEKKKKHGIRKTTVVTPEESSPELVKNNILRAPEISAPTPIESTQELTENKTPQIALDNPQQSEVS